MILVTGATGSLGAHLAYHLLQENDKIIAIKRKSSSLHKIEKIFSFYTNEPEQLLKRIEWRNADITNVFELSQAFISIDEVYHCAGYISLDNRNYEHSINVNVHGTENIVNLCLENKIKKLCHVSSIAAIGENNGRKIDEQIQLKPEQTESVYSLSKYHGEMEVWRGIAEGLNAVIVSPSIILSPYIPGKQTKKLIKWVFNHGIKYYFPGIMGYIDVNDLARMMILLQKSEISGEKFIASAENLSFRQVIDYVNLAIDKPAAKIEIKKSFLNVIRYAGYPLLYRTLTKQTIDYLYSKYEFSNEKIKKAIDFEFIPIQKSIARMVDIYKNKIL